MKCNKCGKENEDNVKFCNNCGNRLENYSAEEVSYENIQKDGNDFVKATKKSAKISPKVIGIGAASLVVAATAAITINNAAHTINLNDYLKVETSGYDGYGIVTESIDWVSLEEKYGDKLTYSGGNYEGYGDLLSFLGATSMDFVKEAVDLDIEKTSYLSNGDEVNYTWDINESFADECNYKFKYKDGSFKVSGLEELETFDAFKDLTVEFYGVSPKGSANLNYLGEDLSSDYFECDCNSDLKNGDVVTVSINSDMIETLVSRTGKIPEISTKDFVVNGLSSYVTKLADIKAADLTKMKKQAQDELDSYVAKTFGETEKFENSAYIGSYLLTKKSDNYNSTENYLYLVYRVKVRDTYTRDTEKYDKVNTFYWCIRYDNVKINFEGDLDIDVNEYSTPSDTVQYDSGISSGWFGTMEWSYKGYESVEDLYKNVVTAQANNYNHEDNVKG